LAAAELIGRVRARENASGRKELIEGRPGSAGSGGRDKLGRDGHRVSIIILAKNYDPRETAALGCPQPDRYLL
jgi:hypothetical protein